MFPGNVPGGDHHPLAWCCPVDSQRMSPVSYPCLGYPIPVLTIPLGASPRVPGTSHSSIACRNTDVYNLNTPSHFPCARSRLPPCHAATLLTFRGSRTFSSRCPQYTQRAYRQEQPVQTGGDPVHDVHVHAGPDVTAPTYKSPKPLLSQLNGLVRRSGPLRRSSSSGSSSGDG